MRLIPIQMANTSGVGSNIQISTHNRQSGILPREYLSMRVLRGTALQRRVAALQLLLENLPEFTCPAHY